MEKEDQFDKEAGFDIAISETGISVKAKSRIVSTLDRWGANFFRKKSFKGERAVQTDEQLISLEAKIVQKAGEKLLKRVDEDDDFALEVLNIAYTREARRRDNKEGVILAALEILKNEAVSEKENIEGPDKLSDEFLDRVERYAEDASSDELKQRWGRILAGEIRKPGTFSKKVLRAIDELESETAVLFESLAQFIVKGAILKPIMPELKFVDAASLVQAGLILDPGMLGHIRTWSADANDKGDPLWVFHLGEYAISIPKELTARSLDSKVIKMSEQEPATPVYVLTEVGKAICSFLPVNDYTPFRAFYSKVAPMFGDGEVKAYKVNLVSQSWEQLPSINI